mmetsp:Transcript_10194/g.24753  ORF Transcript_10194/g.24753 Transcript_10194/m.24753 type:complete len:430 (-) Transcript_10194:87-1376(-)
MQAGGRDRRRTTTSPARGLLPSFPSFSFLGADPLFDPVDLVLHRRRGFKLPEERVVAPLDDVQLLVGLGGLALLHELLASGDRDAEVVRPVVDVEGNEEGRHERLGRLERPDQPRRGSEGEGFPGLGKALVPALLRHDGPDLRILPDPLGGDRVRHEEGRPGRSERFQDVHQEGLDRPRGDVPVEGGVVQDAPHESLRFFRIVPQRVGRVKRDASPVGFSHHEEGGTRRVLRRDELHELDHVVAVDRPVPVGDVEPRPLRVAVPELVVGVQSVPLRGELARAQRVVGVPSVRRDLDPVPRLAVDPVLVHDDGPDRVVVLAAAVLLLREVRAVVELLALVRRLEVPVLRIVEELVLLLPPILVGEIVLRDLDVDARVAPQIVLRHRVERIGAGSSRCCCCCCGCGCCRCSDSSVSNGAVLLLLLESPQVV